MLWTHLFFQISSAQSMPLLTLTSNLLRKSSQSMIKLWKVLNFWRKGKTGKKKSKLKWTVHANLTTFFFIFIYDGISGFSQVYLAQDDQQHYFAVKRIPCKLGIEQLKLAQREVYIHRLFQHKNIVPLKVSAKYWNASILYSSSILPFLFLLLELCCGQRTRWISNSLCGHAILQGISKKKLIHHCCHH